MDTLTTLLMQTACRSTHHKLAVDALWQIRHPAATAWRNLFLTQYRAYLRGAKAPDDEFKDFRNHVLHVAQNNWGGAVPTASYWYDQTVEALRAEDWTTAAYNAGVLSHYYSDPHMPLHTGQSEAETNMHRAAEWSVTKSYDQLRRIIDESGRWPAVDAPRGEGWLAQMVLAGAELSHPHYELLVREYDLARGVLDPVRGWNDRCRRVLADLLAHAIVGFARILERAIEEANVAPPDTSPALEVFLVTVNQPIRAVLNKIADVRERAQIEAMFNELQATGKVEEHLSEEQRVIRSEVAQYRAQQPKVVTPKSAPRPAVTPVLTKTLAAKPVAAKPVPAKPVPDKPAFEKTTPATMKTVSLPLTSTSTPAKPEAKPAPEAKSLVAASAPVVKEDPPKPEPKPELKPEPKPEVKVAAATIAATPSADKSPKYRLELTDMLERAPSIGPKTANRLLAHGWRTVGEFLAADPADVSQKLNSSWATTEIVTDWQKQAWLVLQIADLSGTGSQLLVGAGYPTIEEVAAAEATEMVGYMAEYCQSSAGQRTLRDAKVPDQITAARWIAAARGGRQVSLQKKSA
jgi:hypothetical protein